MIQVQISVGDIHKVHLGSVGHQQVFANNSRMKRATDMSVVSLCLSCHEASSEAYLDTPIRRIERHMTYLAQYLT